MAPSRRVALLAVCAALACAAPASGALVKEPRARVQSSANPFTAASRYSTFPLPLDVSRADGVDVLPQIVGGRDAKLGEFPHQASMQVTMPRSLWVQSRPQHLCGGTLIASNWVLTAAHCVYGVPNSATKVEVVLGIDNLAVKAAGSQRIAVERMLVHSKYDHYANNGVGPYDIAMLKLVRAAKESETVKRAVLPAAAAPEAAGTAVLSGWGSTSQDGRRPKYPNQLQTAEFPVVSYSDCLAFVTEADDSGEIPSLLKETNLCVGPLDEAGKSSCSGDSGGPLVQRADGDADADASPTVIGVVSWGLTNCGSVPFPSIFTRVSSYLDWIHAVQDKYQ